jgi:hypothetical protein
MSNVIRFPRAQRQPVATAEEDIGASVWRNLKWTTWKHEVKRWGGGHRRPDGKFNSAALADIAVDKQRWREPAYRTAMATTVLELLFENRLIGIGVRTPRLYWFNDGKWKHRSSDRLINRMLAKYFNFVRDGEALRPPRWLPEALRFAAYDFLNAED